MNSNRSFDFNILVHQSTAEVRILLFFSGNGLRALKAFNDSTPLSQRKTTFDMIDEHFNRC